MGALWHTRGGTVTRVRVASLVTLVGSAANHADLMVLPLSTRLSAGVHLGEVTAFSGGGALTRAIRSKPTLR